LRNDTLAKLGIGTDNASIKENLSNIRRKERPRVRFGSGSRVFQQRHSPTYC